MDVVHQSTGRCNSLGFMAVSPRPRVKWNMKTKHNAVGDLIFESSDHFLGILFFFETKHTYILIVPNNFWWKYIKQIYNHPSNLLDFLKHYHCPEPLTFKVLKCLKNVHGTICLIFNLCINQWKGGMKKNTVFFGQYQVFFDYARNTWQLFFHLKKSRYKVQ